MLWKSIFAAVFIAVSGGAVLAGQAPYTSDLASENLPNLVSIASAMNSMCRDRPDAQRECDRRDEAYKELKSRGWCWGPDGAIGADKSWIACPNAIQSSNGIPRFDVAAHCRQISSTGGSPSEVIYGSCMEIEQSAYNQMKPSWTSIPSSIQDHCTTIAKIGGSGSYTILQSCIEQEIAAKKANIGTSFDY